MLDIKTISNSRIIVSALDWGFGHTTRILVVIKQLLLQNNTIEFAGNKKQVQFIATEIPGIKTSTLSGYNIKLDSRKNTYWQVIKQIPKIVLSIKHEYKWLKNRLKEKEFDYIISDNRYGFRNKGIPSIILTHQTSLQIPFGKKPVNFALKKQLGKFYACWIPDNEAHEFSGKLSKAKLNIPIFFIGPLSRLNLSENSETEYDFLFLISGPKPECDLFLEKSLQFINNNQLNAAVAIPFSVKKTANNKKNIFENLNTLALSHLINNSKTVITKAGYTSLMDLLPSRKPIIILPTKGQYEQMYLQQLHKKRQSNAPIAATILENLQ